MKLNQKTQAFVEKLGLLFERLGSTRTAGRMMGLMLVADAPMSLADMAGSLNVSKASMSTNARLAEQLGMVQRVSLPGDRRDYYELTPGSFEEMVARRIKAIDAFILLANEGLKAIDKDNERARTRLEKMRDFYQFFVSELDTLLERWQERTGRDDG
jgi:DNA-binding transcriptional regulator GbsR (MarR family)